MPYLESRSERFFGSPYFAEWLTWVQTHADTDPAAAQLNSWLDGEVEHLVALVSHDERAKPGQKRLLNVGCGFGRHEAILATRSAGWDLIGADVRLASLLEARANLLRVKSTCSTHFVVADAANLACFKQRSFGAITCMTNTFGNLLPETRRKLIQYAFRLLAIGGELLISFYLPGASMVRAHSYEAVGLHPTIESGRVRVAEGLVSESFSVAAVGAMLRDFSLQVDNVQIFSDIACLITATLEE